MILRDSIDGPYVLVEVVEKIYLAERTTDTVEYKDNVYRLLLNYLLRFGLKYTYLKVKSRLLESGKGKEYFL